MMIVWLIIAGAVGGVFGGMGMGGGTLLIPILTIFLQVGQKQAQFINLATFVVMASIALIIHCKNHLVKFKDGLLLAGVGIVFSVGSSLLISKVNNEMLRFLFGTFLVMIAMIQLTLMIVNYINNRGNLQTKSKWIY